MRQTYLLDTHLPVDASSIEGLAALPVQVRSILQDPKAELLLSVVSEVEIAIKSALGKLDLSREELAFVCANAGITSYPLRQHHADRMFALPPHHKDPFDRMIISTALSEGLPVISRDRQFRKYAGLRVIWS